MTNKAIKILLVDDHSVVRKGMKMLIESKMSEVIVYEANDGVEALQILGQSSIDVMLTDITMPNMNGLELIKQSSVKFPNVKKLVISMHLDEMYIKEAIEAGSNGYLSKEMEDENEIIDGIKAVLDGKSFHDKTTSQVLIKSMFSENKKKLTPKEVEIAKHLANGLVYKEIAHQMDISPRTVETYRKNILEKLEIETTADIIKYAIKNNIITI